MAQEKGQKGSLRWDGIVCIHNSEHQVQRKGTGQFRCNEEGFRWMGKTGAKVSLTRNEMEELEWTQVGPKAFQLKLYRSGAPKRESIRFHGFLPHNFQELSTYVKENYQINITNVPISTNGWNWGDFDFTSNALQFQVDNKRGFRLDYPFIQHASIQTKNEVELRLHPSENDREDCLTQMRIYIPPTPDSTDETTPAQTFHDKLTERANLAIDKKKAIASFEDLLLVTPRGRYQVDMYGEFLDLHGKTYSYKVFYDHIDRLFLLETPNNTRMFIVSMSPPLRQGQTSYPFMILRFQASEDIELSLNLTQQEIDEKYPDQLAQDLEGPVCDVVSRVFKALINRKVVVSGKFLSVHGDKCIRCSLKANDGYLFPMEKSFFFIHKPPTYIRHKNIANVEFLRVHGGGNSSNAKTFDVLITMRNEASYTFTSINKDEYDTLFKFLATRKDLQIVDKEEHERKLSSSLAKGTRSRGRKAISSGGHDPYVAQMHANRDDAAGSGSDSDDDDEDFKGDGESAEDSEDYFSKSEASSDDDAEMKEPKRSRAGDSSSSSSSSKKPRID